MVWFVVCCFLLCGVVFVCWFCCERFGMLGVGCVVCCVFVVWLVFLVVVWLVLLLGWCWFVVCLFWWWVLCVLIRIFVVWMVRFFFWVGMCDWLVFLWCWLGCDWWVFFFGIMRRKCCSCCGNVWWMSVLGWWGVCYRLFWSVRLWCWLCGGCVGLWGVCGELRYLFCVLGCLLSWCELFVSGVRWNLWFCVCDLKLFVLRLVGCYFWYGRVFVFCMLFWVGFLWRIVCVGLYLWWLV